MDRVAGAKTVFFVFVLFDAYVGRMEQMINMICDIKFGQPPNNYYVKYCLEEAP